MNTYLCDDGNAEIEIQADTARDAAQESEAWLESLAEEVE